MNFYLNHSVGVEFSLYHISFPAVSIHSNEAICVANGQGSFNSVLPQIVITLTLISLMFLLTKQTS